MKTFKDKKNREWQMELDLAVARRIDNSDFTEYYPKKFSIVSLEPPDIQAILQRPSLMFAIIWAWVQPQAVEMHKTGTFPVDPADEEAAELEFVSGINAQAKADAQQAFLEAMADFFPELRTALSISSQQLRKLSDKVRSKVLETEPLLEKMVDDDLEAMIQRLKADHQKTRDERLGGILESLRPSPAGSLASSGRQD
jgi:hypothetical protein